MGFGSFERVGSMSGIRLVQRLHQSVYRPASSMDYLKHTFAGIVKLCSVLPQAVIGSHKPAALSAAAPVVLHIHRCKIAMS